MSDKNPSTKPITLAIGTVRDDIFDHVFLRLADDLRALGLLVVPGEYLKNLKGKRVRVQLMQEAEQ